MDAGFRFSYRMKWEIITECRGRITDLEPWVCRSFERKVVGNRVLTRGHLVETLTTPDWPCLIGGNGPGTAVVGNKNSFSHPTLCQLTTAKYGDTNPSAGTAVMFPKGSEKQQSDAAGQSVDAAARRSYNNRHCQHRHKAGMVSTRFTKGSVQVSTATSCAGGYDSSTVQYIQEQRGSWAV